ncbi:hypothetical protein RHSIM_Rhsim12G0097000 [Rhododendron simsii]|uniref:Uncharacterized protein n=1 Tax=Rhododendron simsii TaxID=118357 RepID=A0A834G379_RHOSS|nr:hypothetical protein RHSIM_Rhsim12G0097000 [Rhododendron simsii]
MISLAKLELKRSTVAGNESGKSKPSEVRTSSGMFIVKGKVFSMRLSFEWINRLSVEWIAALCYLTYSGFNLVYCECNKENLGLSIVKKKLMTGLTEIANKSCGQISIEFEFSKDTCKVLVASYNYSTLACHRLREIVMQS